MTKKHFYSLLLFFISCQLPRTNQGVGGEDELKSDDLDISEHIAQQTDTNITLNISTDTAFYKKGEILLVKSFIAPKIIIGGDSINPKELRDEGFIIASCLIILRNITSVGHYCHMPSIGRIEIYTPNGKDSIIEKGVFKSKSLLAFDFTSNFLGNRFNSPCSSWGLITIEAEGQLYGYLIIKPDGTLTEINIDEKVCLTGETFNAAFNKNNELVWSNMREGEVLTELIVKSNGNYSINKKDLMR